MKKFNLFLLLPLMIGMSACQSKLKVDDVIESVLEGERSYVSMKLLESPPIADNITVDSLRLLVKSEPMSGYLYTTWYDGQKSFSIIVKVTNIRNSKEHKDDIVWNSDWSTATCDYLEKLIDSY